MIRALQAPAIGMILLIAGVCDGASFRPGDVVVYRVGDGVGALSGNGNPVFLDEYTQGGTLVQSIALPTSTSGAAHQLVASGTATSEGQLTRSADGQYVLLTGYASDLPAAAALASSAAASVPRTVGRVAFDGTIDTSTALGDFADGNNPRAATSTDGTSLWVGGGAGGVRYATVGAASSTQLSADSTNVRFVQIVAGQLYMSTQKGSLRVATVGSGTPTTAGQSISNLPGFPMTGSPDAVFLADLDGMPGLDTLYVADEAAGLLKYSLVAGHWSVNGTVGTGADAYRGVTGEASGGSVILFATRKGDSGGELVSLIDTGGFNGVFSGTPTLVATAAASEAFRGVALAPAQARAGLPQAAADAYATTIDTALTVPAATGVLANDDGSPLSVVVHGQPVHGTLTLAADGGFTYTPETGYVGTDAFSYTVSDAARLYAPDLPPLATFGGVALGADYGSSLAAVPGSPDEVYGLTDLGPHVNGPNGTNVEPLPAFDPAIGKFTLLGGGVVLEQAIPLKDGGGNPYSGRVNSQHPSGETLTSLNGAVLPADPNGYDPEGLAVMADGTFWVSDEYGPFLTHFDASGLQIERLSPLDASLPAELGLREPNRGLEGLTVTPDGTTLVAMMQSALRQADLGGADPHRVAIVRLFTYRLSDGDTHEYLYLLDEPSVNKTSVSEIRALTGSTLLVIERDSEFPPQAYKKLWKIDLAAATDVGPSSTVAGASYDGGGGGLRIAGHTLEALVNGLSAAGAASVLAGDGIVPVAKTLFLDVGAQLDALDPHGRFFSHDKIEGLALLDGGATVLLSNDSDFGVDGVTNNDPPLQLHPKIVPSTGAQETSEILAMDLTHLPVVTASATVSITVAGAVVPPDNATRSCEDGVATGLAKFAACVRKCHVKRADAALKGVPFDDDACEAGTGKPVSCRAKYDATSATLVAKGGCPACLDAAAQAALADFALGALETEVGTTYCAGGTAFGGDDPGFVPPDKSTAKCEDQVMKRVRTAAGCFAKCAVKDADAASKGAAFDRAACETGLAKSCRAKYDAASTKLEAAMTCPPCLGAVARGDVADAAHGLHEQARARIYCDGTVPLP